MSLASELLQALAARQAEFVAIRHDLHRHPELGFQETRTASIVARAAYRPEVVASPPCAPTHDTMTRSPSANRDEADVVTVPAASRPGTHGSVGRWL